MFPLRVLRVCGGACACPYGPGVLEPEDGRALEAGEDLHGGVVVVELLARLHMPKSRQASQELNL